MEWKFGPTLVSNGSGQDTESAFEEKRRASSFDPANFRHTKVIKACSFTCGSINRGISVVRAPRRQRASTKRACSLRYDRIIGVSSFSEQISWLSVWFLEQRVFRHFVGVSRGVRRLYIYIFLYTRINEEPSAVSLATVLVVYSAVYGGYNYIYVYIYIYIYIYMRLVSSVSTFLKKLGHRQGTRPHAEAYTLRPEIPVVTATAVNVPVRGIVQIRRV